jgi:hypothetical protein
MRRTYRTGSIALWAALATGCAGVETVPPPTGNDEYVLACDKAQEMPACEERVRQVCPEGFETLSSEEDFERHELRFRCSANAAGR